MNTHDTLCDTSKAVSKPDETDILCGRGGVSNHHPGNEWYRCLLRCTRDWYRECPKHTKILMSKAIVRAIHKQGRRFLVQNNNDGMWYPASYKKSVQKTSQGLREREKDNNGSSSLALSTSNAPQSLKEILHYLKQVVNPKSACTSACKALSREDSKCNAQYSITSPTAHESSPEGNQCLLLNQNDQIKNSLQYSIQSATAQNQFERVKASSAMIQLQRSMNSDLGNTRLPVPLLSRGCFDMMVPSPSTVGDIRRTYRVPSPFKLSSIPQETLPDSPLLMHLLRLNKGL